MTQGCLLSWRLLPTLSTSNCCQRSKLRSKGVPPTVHLASPRQRVGRHRQITIKFCFLFRLTEDSDSAFVRLNHLTGN